MGVNYRPIVLNIRTDKKMFCSQVNSLKSSIKIPPVSVTLPSGVQVLNQAAQCLGNKVEMSITKCIEANKTLLKVIRAKTVISIITQIIWCLHKRLGNVTMTPNARPLAGWLVGRSFLIS